MTFFLKATAISVGIVGLAAIVSYYFTSVMWDGGFSDHLPVA